MARAQAFDTTTLAAAGLRVIRRSGWSSVTMRSIADELGVSPMALYRLTPTANHLRHLLANATAPPLPPPIPPPPAPTTAPAFAANAAASSTSPSASPLAAAAAAPPLPPSVAPSVADDAAPLAAVAPLPSLPAGPLADNAAASPLPPSVGPPVADAGAVASPPSLPAGALADNAAASPLPPSVGPPVADAGLPPSTPVAPLADNAAAPPVPPSVGPPVAEAVAPGPLPTPGPLGDVLQSWAVDAYGHLRRLPGVASYVVLHWTELPGWLDVVEALLARADASGLSGPPAVAKVNAVFAYVLVRAQLHDGLATAPRRSMAPLRAEPARYPFLTHHRPEFARAQTDRHFNVGLTALIIGLPHPATP